MAIALNSSTPAATRQGQPAGTPPRQLPGAPAPLPNPGDRLDLGTGSVHDIPLTHVFQFAVRLDGATTDNACGTSAVAMVLKKYLGERPETQVQNIDQAIRPARVDLFATPPDLARYLKRQGMRTHIQTGTSVQQLQGYIDQGIPVICLITANPGGGKSWGHYVVAEGYKTDEQGRITQVLLNNPARPAGPETVAVGDFLDWWNHPGNQANALKDPVAASVEAYQRLIIVAIPQAGNMTTPDGRTIPAAGIRLPEPGKEAPAADIADVVSSSVTAGVRLGVNTGAGLARLRNWLLPDASDRAATTLNTRTDRQLQRLPLLGHGGKYWNLEQCLWGLVTDTKKQAIVRLLSNTSPQDLATIQQNLPGGLAKVYLQLGGAAHSYYSNQLRRIVAQAVNKGGPSAAVLSPVLDGLNS